MLWVGALLACAPRPSTSPPADARVDVGVDGGLDEDAAAPDAELRLPMLPDAGPAANPEAKFIAYVSCTCGFGPRGWNLDVCRQGELPGANHVLAWERAGVSPVTHYVLAFLSFEAAEIRTDPGSLWVDGGGSTTRFALVPEVLAAMKQAQANGKRILLSIGGETGSTGMIMWWMRQGADEAARVAAIRTRLEGVVAAFEAQNPGLQVDGFDLDVELPDGYPHGGDNYASVRDLINAVPQQHLVGFVPQVGGGLCAAPLSIDDRLGPIEVLGGQCQMPAADGQPWSLTRLDQDCKRADGVRPRLDYLGLQYYNAVDALCCGGGDSLQAMLDSTTQHYINLANGWPEVTLAEMEDPNSPWHAFRWFPGPWPAYAGFGADRLLLGKPACKGCAGSNYLSYEQMNQLIAGFDRALDQPMGGVVMWDLCRLFGDRGPLCSGGGSCGPSWADHADQVLERLHGMASGVRGLRRR